MPTPLVRSKRSLKPLLMGAPSLAVAAAVVTDAGGVPKLVSPIWQTDQRHSERQGHRVLGEIVTWLFRKH